MPAGSNGVEDYVHRIGRTGRADASGIALSFCDVEERAYLKKIQKLINQRIPVIEDHPFTTIINVQTFYVDALFGSDR